MSNVPTSTGLPITWQWCKRHDWKHEKVVCPFCRAEKAERERDEARKAEHRYRKALLWCEINLSYAGRLGMPRSVSRSVSVAARAAGKEAE